ncbi:type III PLP-dependent enzyme [Chloroflexota bacterium]
MLTEKMKYRDIERIALAKQTPFLVIDRDVIQRKFGELQRAIGPARICYALKANSHRRIVKLLQELGADFEISSQEELSFLLSQGIPPRRLISSNPVKTEGFIRAAHASGVELLAFDSYAEVEKLAQFAPGSKVYVRLSVSNEGSQWPLSRKFGVEVEEAVKLLVEAGERGLDPYGITFHVGSQCTEQATWIKALEESKRVWDLAMSRGLKLRMLNIGGGFPIKYVNPAPSIVQIARTVRDVIEKTFSKDIEIFVEPGRAIVGEAGVLVATVIGKGARNGERWVYLDVGVFNGLMESIGGIKYPIAVPRDGPKGRWVLAGPSCDSFDVISTEAELTEPEVGGKVHIMSAGAYTTAYASNFNGFCIPKTYFI